MQNLKSKPSFSFRLNKTFWIALLGISFAFFVFLSRGPDFDLQFTREVPSSLDPNRIDRNLSSVSRWPQWFFSTAEVSLSQDQQASPNWLVKTGSQVQIKIDPKKGQRKKFEILGEVTEYEPSRKLQLRIKDDSSGRLNKLFDDIYWNIEIRPRPASNSGKNSEGSLIKATITAHTKHWRSRLFGRLAEKILLNQIFYPNVLKLAELKQPFSVDQQGSQSSGLFAP
jgi:hypothetical protein